MEPGRLPCEGVTRDHLPIKFHLLLIFNKSVGTSAFLVLTGAQSPA